MSVKVLMRRPGPGAASAAALSPPPQTSLYNTITGRLSDLFTAASRARKPASGEPLSVLSRIKEFFVFNAPHVNIPTERLAELVSKVKMPLIAALGVAAVAGIAFLVYKLYKHFNERSPEQLKQRREKLINDFMMDIKAVAPDLVKVEGWFQSIEREVLAALDTDDEAEIVARLAKIKEAAIEHQANTAGKDSVGGGIDFFARERSRKRPQRPVRPNVHAGDGIRVMM